MNIKRGIAAGILLWLLIFFEVSILMFGLKLQAGTTYYAIHYIALAVLTALAALFYFKGKKTKRNAKEGFLIGIVMVVTGIILDAVITVPLFVKSYASFLDPYLIVGLAEIVLIATIVGATKPKAKKAKPKKAKKRR